MRSVPFLLTLLISFLSLWIWWRGEEDITRQSSLRLEQEANRLGSNFRRHMRGQRALLMSSQGLVTSQPLITATEWRLFHQALLPAGIHDGLQNVFFFQMVTDPQLPGLELQQRVLHGGNFALQGKKAEGGRHLIGVQGVSLIPGNKNQDSENNDPVLQSLLGRDLLAPGVVLPDLKVLTDAVDLEQTRISDKIDLALQSGMRSAHLMIMPVFKDGWSTGTSEERWQALRGVLVGLSNVVEVGEQVGQLGADHIVTAVFDHGMGFGSHQAQTPEWSSDPDVPWTQDGMLTSSVSVFFGGRSWEIRVGALPEAFSQPTLRAANMIRSLGGIVIAFLVGGIVWLLVARREKAEENVADMSSALRHSEARYSQLFRHNRAVELLIDPTTGQIVDANEAAASFYGIRRDVLCQMSIFEINCQSPEAIREDMARAQREVRTDFNFRHRRAGGEIRDVEVLAGPISVDLGDGRGTRSLLYSVVHDITNRKEAERALAESEAQFRVLFEKSPLAIQILNEQGQTIRVNGSWEHLWKQSSAAAISSGKSLLSDPQLRDSGVAALLQKALEGHVVEIPAFSYNLPGIGAHSQWIHAFAYPIPREGTEDGAGEIIIIYDNVTDSFHQQQRLKRTLEDLQHSNEELEQFAYVASHDLQEPLRMVSSYLNLLSKRYGDSMNSEAREFMDFALDGARRMQDLIRDLLDYARVGRVVDDTAAVDSRRALDDAQGELAGAIEKSEAKITHGQLPYVAVDGGELTRLFTNLLGNAIKYAQPGVAPVIHVDARRQDDMWRFTVDDNGVGIAPENHDKVFKIFQRLHAAGVSSGTGVGLAICRKIVEHNGGQIGVLSQVGSGSSFWFTLPAHSEEISASADE